MKNLLPTGLPTPLLRTAAVFAVLCMAKLAMAQTVTIQNPWVRATVQGQMATGAYMALTSANGARLKSVSSPVAGVAEVHEMRMDGDIMTMAAVKGGLELPAGKTVELKPGGYHIMLMDLKAPVRKDSKLPMTLVFVDAKGVESKTEISVPVGNSAPKGALHSGH